MAAIGVVVSAVLATTKIAAGVIGNSFALVADGVESVLDIFSGLLVWGGLRVSALPQSDRYPYGLGKAEPLASLVVSTVLLLAAVGIAIGATQEIMSPQEVPESFTLMVLIGVLIAKEVMFRVLSTQGREIGSQSLNTDAWHHRSDALTSLAAFIGISVAGEAELKSPVNLGGDIFAGFFADTFGKMRGFLVDQMAVVHGKRLQRGDGGTAARSGFIANQRVKILQERHGQRALLINVNAALAVLGAILGVPLAIVEFHCLLNTAG